MPKKIVRKDKILFFNVVRFSTIASILTLHFQIGGVLSPRLALRRGLSVLFHVVSLRWKLYRAGWEKSALARQHKRAFDWPNQSGSSGLGPLPRKHSLEGVSPYPCALAERSQYYQRAAFALSPPLSSPPPPSPTVLSPPAVAALFPYLCERGSSTLLRPLFSSHLPPPPCMPYALSILTDSHQEAAI